jgi:peptide/nickel transport system permease protein
MNYVGKKILHLIVVVLAVTSLTFLMVDLLPGDAAYGIVGQEATLDDIHALQKELGLTENIVLRYFKWLSNAVSGNLGTSFLTHESVISAIVSRLPVTIELMLIAQIIAITLSIPCAILCAYRPQSGIDKTLTGLSLTTMSTPVFVMALVLIYLFAVKLQWLPATGYVPLKENLWLNVRSFILPALSIALVEWVPLMRVLRSDMITTLQKDYILMARSKGLPVYQILFKHALRPSLFTLLTLLGLQIGHLIGGALIVETIFALPGIGRLLVNAIFNQDTNLIQGCILVISIAYVVINFIVDILYTVIDPRVTKGAFVG